MKYSNGKRLVRIGDPVLVERQSGILSGYIVGFSKGDICCHVSRNNILWKKVYSSEITFWINEYFLRNQK